MGIVVGDPNNSLALSLVAILTSCLSLSFLALFLYRKQLQPIRYRGPRLIALTVSMLVLREIMIFILEQAPLSVPCLAIILYNNGLYQAFAVSVCRLWLLLFAYKIQQERLTIQERNEDGFRPTSKEWFISHIKFVRRKFLIAVTLFATVVPNILEVVFAKEIPADEILAYKQQDRNYNYTEENLDYIIQVSNNFTNVYNFPTYINFKDRCPNGSIDPDFYLYVMIFYFLCLIGLISKLRVFQKDKFYINSEFRFLGIWLILFIVSDFLIVNVIFDAQFVYENSPEQFNECLFILLLVGIYLIYPLRLSYYLARKRENFDDDDFNETDLLRSHNTTGSEVGSTNFEIIQTTESIGESTSMGSSKDNLNLQQETTFTEFTKADFKPLKPENANSRRLLRYMKNKQFLKMFKNHLTLEFSIENYLCWVKGVYVLKDMRTKMKVGKTTTKMLSGGTTKEEQIHSAVIFVNTFIRESSYNQVNIPSKMRVKVEERMDDLEMVNENHIDSFNKAMVNLAHGIQEVLQEVLKLMSSDSLARLKLTEEYKVWVKKTKAARGTVVVNDSKKKRLIAKQSSSQVDDSPESPKKSKRLGKKKTSSQVEDNPISIVISDSDSLATPKR